MKYNFDLIIDRENTSCVKYDLRKEYFGKADVIPLWVADMDFETPDFIRQAIIKRAEHPIYGYGIKSDSWYQSIINWLDDRHRWSVAKNQISFSPGVVPGFTFAMLALTEPGDQIVVQPPVYFPFFNSVTDNGRILLHNELIENNNYYTIDFDDLEEKLRHPKTKILILSSPHNPVGRVWKKGELERMVDLCYANGTVLLSDEIHGDLILSGQTHIPTASLSPKAQEITVTFMAPSKTFNLAGMATSFLVIQNPELKAKYDEMLNALHLNGGNIFGALALEAAYENGGDWLDQLLNYIEENVDFTQDFLRKNIPRISFQKPEATYLLWLNCKSLQLSDEELRSFFVEKANLGLNGGIVFGPGGSGYMRLNVACPRAILKQALQNLSEAFRDH